MKKDLSQEQIVIDAIENGDYVFVYENDDTFTQLEYSETDGFIMDGEPAEFDQFKGERIFIFKEIQSFTVGEE